MRDKAQIIPARDKILSNLDRYSDFYRSGTVEEFLALPESPTKAGHLTSPIANFNFKIKSS
ncbi:hypothetical protein A3H53_03915 [Candidatus Nomurabacteria bacterium RIFCSPLOWO2_02_FULL_40_10]|uniref:Uncharacterized protein n=1 Tax=Candidatus Nomurabacteria bacterium RIFCSPLOWO2_02_FULL_40_10 TaxID=1801786 RepID=A0A1F6XW66_9BACT|nr:MAG: hypothetical protein A3H53_03915 [Candidatus Nomurabacteria bacterium RIFCSPLOWO2_02_FULL_40_10]